MLYYSYWCFVLKIKRVVHQLRQISPSKKLPLVVLHQARVKGGPAQQPNNKILLESWKKAGALYATPQGSNDDWCLQLTTIFFDTLYHLFVCACVCGVSTGVGDGGCVGEGAEFLFLWSQSEMFNLYIEL